MEKSKKKSKRNRVSFNNLTIEQFNNILLSFFIFFLPTQLGKHFFLDFSYVSGVKVDYLSLVLYLTDLLVLLLAILYKHIIINNLRKNLKLIIFFLFFLISNILVSQYSILSFYHLLKIIELYFVFVILNNFKNEELLLISFLSGGFFQLVICLLQLYQKSSLQGFFYFFGERYLSFSQPGVARASFAGVEFLRPYGTFSHPNSLAGFYLLLYFFFLTRFKFLAKSENLFGLINKNFSRFILLKNLSLLVFTLLIFVSFSKTAIVTYLMLNIFYFIGHYKANCQLCVLAKTILIIVVASVFLQAKTDPLSLEKRVNLLKNGFSIFLNHPFFGVGLKHYLIYQAEIPMRYPYFFLQPVHNIFLLFLAETGIVLTAFVGYILWQSFRKYLKNTAFIICLLTVLITGFFDHYWLTLQQNWLLLGVVFGGLFNLSK